MHGISAGIRRKVDEDLKTDKGIRSRRKTEKL